MPFYARRFCLLLGRLMRKRLRLVRNWNLTSMPKSRLTERGKLQEQFLTRSCKIRPQAPRRFSTQIRCRSQTCKISQDRHFSGAQRPARLQFRPFRSAQASPPLSALRRMLRGGVVSVPNTDSCVYQNSASAVAGCSTTLPSGLTIPSPTINGSGSFSSIANGSAAGSAPIYIQNITGWDDSAGGINGGLRIINSNDGGLSGNPGAGGAVSASIFIDNTNGRGGSGQALFGALNTACDQQPTTASPAGSFSTNDCDESDISRSVGGALSTPFDAPGAWAFYASAGINLSSNPQQPNIGFLALSADTSAKTDWFYDGFVASRIANSGFFCTDHPADTLHGFATSCFQDGSQSAATLLISGTHTSAIDTSGATLTNLVNGSAGTLAYPHSNIGIGDAFYIGSTSAVVGIEFGVGGNANTNAYISTDGSNFFQTMTNGSIPLLFGFNNSEKMRINGTTIELEENTTIGAGSAITSSGPGGALTAPAFQSGAVASQTCTVNQAKTLTFTNGILTGGTCNT